MERVYDKTRPEEVAPEMGSALDRARATFLVLPLLYDLELSRSGVAPAMCPKSLSEMGRRVRAPGLSGMQNRTILSLLRRSSESEPAAAECDRDGDSALQGRRGGRGCPLAAAPRN